MWQYGKMKIWKDGNMARGERRKSAEIARWQPGKIANISRRKFEVWRHVCMQTAVAANSTRVTQLAKYLEDSLEKLSRNPYKCFWICFYLCKIDLHLIFHSQSVSGGFYFCHHETHQRGPMRSANARVPARNVVFAARESGVTLIDSNFPMRITYGKLASQLTVVVEVRADARLWRQHGRVDLIFLTPWLTWRRRRP